MEEPEWSSKQETSFRQECKRFQSLHYATKDDFTVGYNKLCNTKIKATVFYHQILSELKSAICEGNFAKLKVLDCFIDYVTDIADPIALNHCLNSAENPLKGTNVVILACKHNKATILAYLLNSDCNILGNLSQGSNIVDVLADDVEKVNSVYDAQIDLNSETNGNLHNETRKVFILPGDKDDSGHNAFYYAIRSGNVELADILITKWPGNYFAVNLEALDEVLSRAYEELKIKNVPLTDEIEIFVERKLLNLRFFSNVSEQDENSDFSTINERIDLVLGNIDLLKTEYSGRKIIDDKFLFVAKFIAQNIHILKQQLKSTYDILPWEEMEFCLASFVSACIKQQEINLFYNATLDKSKIVNYLDIFATELKNRKDNITNEDKGKFSEFPKLERETVVSKIIRDFPQFEQLYRDYQLIRDVHSLGKISDFVKLAVSADPKHREGQLIIIRALQRIGEHFKNTLESPMLSRTVNELLLHSLPKNTRLIIMDLRNAQSHVESFAKRTEIFDNSDVNFFRGVQNDANVIDTVIFDILRKSKVKIVKLLINKIVNSESLAEIKEIAAIVTDWKLDELVVSCLKRMEHDELGEIVEKVRNKITDMTICEKELFANIRSVVNDGIIYSPSDMPDFAVTFSLIKDLRLLLNYNKIDDKPITGLKFASKRSLENMPSLMEPESLKMVAGAMIQVSNSVRFRLKCDKLDEVNKCICEILYIVEFETGDAKWIEELRNNWQCSFIPVNKPVVFNLNDDNFNNQLGIKISELKGILNNNGLTGNSIANISSYKKDKKLQAVVELLVLDILSILGRSDHLENNLLFLDDNSPLLTGKCLRNHLAHDNTLLDVLLSDPSIAVVLNAEKLITENVVTCKKRIGTFVRDDPLKLKEKFNHSLGTINNQTKMFSALEEGNLTDCEISLKSGADINARSSDASTALHFAARGSNLNVIQSVTNKKLVVVNGKDIRGRSPLHTASAYGRKNIVEFLIRDAEVNVNDIDGSGKTALHIAVINDHIDIVDFLLENNADTNIKDKGGFSPLHYAISNNHIKIAKLLLKKETNVDINEAACGLTPLHIAAESGIIELVNFLLDNGANVLARNDKNDMPLHAAALKGNAEVVTALIRKGAYVNAVDIFGSTPLHCASENGHKDVVDILLKHKANVNALSDSFKTTPLHFASKFGHEEIVKTLLKNGANASLANEDGFTPLHFAVESSHVKVVIALLEHGVDVNAKNSMNSTVLHIAADIGHKLITKLLLKYGANPNVNARNHNNIAPLHMATLKGHKDVVELLLQNNADVAVEDIHGSTPLHASAYSGVTEIVENLIKNKAKVDAKTKDCYTPLYLASLNGHLAIVKYFIKCNADVNTIGKFGCAPIHGAIINGHKDIVQLLIQNGAKLNDKNTSCTPLQVAVEEGRKEIAEILIANGANVNIKREDVTPLLGAIKFHREEIVELLVSHGACVDSENGEPLATALLAGSKTIVEILLKNKASVNVKLLDENTPLHICVEHCDKEIVKALIANGAKVDAKNIYGITPLFIAALGGHVEVVEVLIANGANVNILNVECAPLHIAAGYGHLNVVKVLLNKGAKADLQDNTGRTALELAVGRGHLKVVKFLMEFKKVDVNAKGIHSYTVLHIASQAGSMEMVEFLFSKGCKLNIKNAASLMPLHIAAIKGHKNILELFLNEGLSVDVLGNANLTPLHYSAINGHFEVVKFLITQGAAVNAKDLHGMTALHYASKYSKKDVVEVLLKNGAIHNIPDRVNGKTPLEVADNGEIKKILSSTAKLFDAVKSDVSSEVEKCIKAGGIVNARNSEGGTPMHYAASKGNDEIVQILLQNKANPNAVAKKGFVPLHYAAKSSHLKTVETLLTSGAKYNVGSASGKTPSQFAIGNDVTRLFEVIERSFKKVNEGIVDVVSDLNAILTLSQIKAVMCAKDNDNNTLIVAAIHSNFPAVEQLKEVWQGDIDSLISIALGFFQSGNYEKALPIFKSCCTRRCNVLGPDNPGTLDIQLLIAETLRSQGLYQEAFNMMQDILNKQSDALGINNKFTLITQGKIALTLHGLRRNQEAFEICQDVLEKVKVIFGTNHLETLGNQLNMALILDSLGKYEEALNINKEVFEKFKETRGPNDRLTLRTQHNIAVVLCNQGKYAESLQIYQDVFERRKIAFGITSAETLTTLNSIAGVYQKENKTDEASKALQEILTIQKKVLPNNHPDIFTTNYNLANLFCKQGKDVSALNIFREIFDKQKAAFGPSHPIVLDMSQKMKLLTARVKSLGIEPSDAERLRKNLNIAASNGDVKSIENLLRGGVDVNEKDSDGRTPLHFAVSNERIDIVNLLINNGANPTEVTNKGNTPLHTATAKANKDIVDILLKLVSSDKLNDFIDAKTIISGTAALHVAAKNGSFDIVLSLLKHGANYEIKNNDGKTPFDLAKDKRVLKLLEAADISFKGARDGNIAVDLAVNIATMDFDEISAIKAARNNEGLTMDEVASAKNNVERK